MLDVLAIGSTVRDVFLEVDFPTFKWSKTPSDKAFILPLGEKLGVKNIKFMLGGSAANASVTFSRQGFKTGLLSKVGNDISGKELLSILKKEKVSTKSVSTNAQKTSYSVVILENGERTILNYGKGSNNLSIKELSGKSLISKWWYLSLAGESYKLLDKLIPIAKKNGIKIALNPTKYHIEKGRKNLLSNLKNISFLVLNDEEASALVGIPFKNQKQLFSKLDNLVLGIVAVTSGKNGVTVSDGKKIYKAGIFKEKKIVDRTGAGDAFGSGFISGLIRKPKDIPYAIKLGSANATSVVESIGATPGILKRGEMERSKRFKNLKIKIS